MSEIDFLFLIRVFRMCLEVYLRHCVAFQTYIPVLLGLFYIR